MKSMWVFGFLLQFLFTGVVVEQCTNKGRKTDSEMWAYFQPYKKEEAFLKVNPLGLVPALEHGGKSLYESDVLVEYIEDLYPPSKEHP